VSFSALPQTSKIAGEKGKTRIRFQCVAANLIHIGYKRKASTPDSEAFAVLKDEESEGDNERSDSFDDDSEDAMVIEAQF
jgi:hypothetical protein